MVKQYPHILNCKTTEQSTVVAGKPVAGATVDKSYPCRYRPNTSAKQIRLTDGKTVIYRGTCYVKGLQVDIKTGNKITVPGLVESGEVLQVYPAQIRTRVIL